MRHRLAPAARAGTATEVARNILGLHGTDPATVFVAAWARMRNADVAGIERELYDTRSLVRVLVMRRTVFALPPDLAAIAMASCRRSVAQVQRRQLVKWIELAHITKDAAGWLKKLEESTCRALATRGQATTAELSRDVPLLSKQLLLAEGRRDESRPNIGPFVLRLLAVDGRVMRGRPRGGWLSTQYSWATTEVWLGDGLNEWTVHEAQAELVRGGTTGIALADDLEPTRPPEPWAALLPGLDPTVMGWAERDWYLGAHRPALFDRSGNAGPTIWWDGRVVGGWAQRRDGVIVMRLLEDIGRDAEAAVEAQAERLRTWLGDRRVLPRFATPLVKELTTPAAAEASASKPRRRSAPRRSQAPRRG